MVKSQDALDATFSALADGTRRAILARLSTGHATVMELAGPHDMSLPAVAKHLGVLARAGLVETEKAGRVRRCTLRPAPLQDAASWLSFYRKFWDMQLSALDAYFTSLSSTESPWPNPAHRKKPSSVSAARSTRRRRKSSTRGSTRR